MSAEERAQILKMLENGKISPEDALTLMHALEDGGEAEGPEEIEVIAPPEPEADSEPEPAILQPEPDPNFDKKIKRFRGLWLVPLAIGLVVTVLGAWWMYSAMLNAGFGFWFMCAWVPFMVGVAVVALAVISKTSRWIYLRVEQKPGERPQRIVLAFPIPSPLLRWGLRNFGHNIPPNARAASDMAMKAVFEDLKEPLFVDVHDDDGGHVQVYIG
jgi:SHOCT-like protein